MTVATHSTHLLPRPPSAAWRLAVLTLVVVAAHAALLQAAATHLDWSASPARQVVTTLQTRRIELAPPAPPPQSATPLPSPVRRAPPPATTARPAQPEATQRISAPEQPVAQVIESPVATESIATATDAAAVPNAVDTLPPALAQAASAPVAVPPAPVEAALPPAPVAMAPSAVLGYKMTGSAKGLDYHANAELVWRNEGSRYDARMTVSVLFLGSRSMASVGELGADGLAPTRFTDKSRSEYAAHFERDKGLITFSANTPPAPWVRGAQDRVSVFLQLGGLLAGNPAAYPAGTTVAVLTAGPRSADTWTFRVEAAETLSLPLGDVATVKLARQPQREYDQRVEVWLAPSLGYLPVRNKITQSNGDFIDQQLSTLGRP